MPGRDRMFAPGGMVIAITTLALAACGGSVPSVTKTLDNPQYTDHSYSDFLVIGVAGDYDNRAAFERVMVSRIKAEGASASAYHAAVVRNQAITRNAVSAAVKSRGFDAVLLARIISSETSLSIAGDSSKRR